MSLWIQLLVFIFNKSVVSINGSLIFEDKLLFSTWVSLEIKSKMQLCIN